MFGTRTNGLMFQRLRDEMDRLFSDYIEGFPRLDPSNIAGGRTFPALNMWEDDHNLYVEAEVPGLRMDDLDVLVVGNELTIKGERRDGWEEDAAYHRRERGVGSFSRVVQLPVEVDAQKAQAGLKDGVLTVTLPKGEAAKPRKIEVKGVAKS